MKTTSQFIVLVILFSALLQSSCRTQHEFEKRKYTEGQYHDFLFGKENAEGQAEVQCTPADSSSATCDSTPQAQPREIFALCNDLVPDSGVRPLNSLVATQQDNHERLNPRTYLESAPADTDAMPESVSAAISGAAFFTLAVGSAAATLVAPQLIWFSAILAIGSPIFLLVALIGGFIAYGQLASGKIDQRYRKYMRIWAIAMILDVFFALLIIFHFVA